MDSILGTIKKMLGVDSADIAFETDLIVDINSALMTLNQIGVGPIDPFFIMDGSATWTDFLGTSNKLEAAKMYIYMKVKIIFDPPTSSFVLDAMKNQITELEWRLNVQVEGSMAVTPVVVVEDDDDF
jgi:hypothetical protein